MKIEIHNGRLIDPAHGVDRRARCTSRPARSRHSDEPPPGWHPNRVIDASRLVVCPGLIDVSARLREPGFEYKATLESEMEAAVAGGVTSLACPPDTDPPLDEPGLVEMLKHRARSLNRAHVYPVGALTVGLAGRDDHRDGRAVGSRLHRVFARRRARWPTRRCCGARCSTRRLSATACWLRPQDAQLAARRRRARRRSGHPIWASPAIPAFAETIALDAIF